MRQQFESSLYSFHMQGSLLGLSCFPTFSAGLNLFPHFFCWAYLVSTLFLLGLTCFHTFSAGLNLFPHFFKLSFRRLSWAFLVYIDNPISTVLTTLFSVTSIPKDDILTVIIGTSLLFLLGISSLLLGFTDCSPTNGNTGGIGGRGSSCRGGAGGFTRLAALAPLATAACATVTLRAGLRRGAAGATATAAPTLPPQHWITAGQEQGRAGQGRAGQGRKD